MTTLETMTAKIEALTDRELRDVMRELMNDFRPECDAVFDICMKVAQARLHSAAFLALCGELEAVA